MKNILKHFVVITKHKYFVGVECFKRGLYWQGFMHDWSKYHPKEFIQSARYFQGTGTPVSVIKAELGYASAWLHHKGHNPHHWEYWTDFFDGEIKACKIPEKYIIEMACDMIGASKAYNKEKYTPKEPLEYLKNNKHKFLMLDEDMAKLEKLLTDIIK